MYVLAINSNLKWKCDLNLNTWSCGLNSKHFCIFMLLPLSSVSRGLEWRVVFRQLASCLQKSSLALSLPLSFMSCKEKEGGDRKRETDFNQKHYNDKGLIKACLVIRWNLTDSLDALYWITKTIAARYRPCSRVPASPGVAAAPSSACCWWVCALADPAMANSSQGQEFVKLIE